MKKFLLAAVVVGCLGADAEAAGRCGLFGRLRAVRLTRGVYGRAASGSCSTGHAAPAQAPAVVTTECQFQATGTVVLPAKYAAPAGTYIPATSLPTCSGPNCNLR